MQSSSSGRRYQVMTDIEREIAFLNARASVLGADGKERGIGTLSEKSLHKILKLYIEPNEEFHEVSMLGSVVDIKNESGIYEIQTRSAERLRPKLEKLLPISKVTVVLPVAKEKTLRWIDMSSGEISEPRKSPKHETVYHAMRELYKIRAYLNDPNLSVKLVFLGVEEFRYLNGWDKSGKHGSTRCERIPTKLFDDVIINSASDYKAFIPETLGERFLSKELCRDAKFPPRIISSVIGVLTKVGAIRAVGKAGRAYVYEKT